MENAAEALKMAGAVLMFIIALSVCIVSFGNVREATDVLLDYRDRETEYIDGDYYYRATDVTTRTVGLDTILPTIERAYTENCKVVFEGLPDKRIYNKITNVGGQYEDVVSFDLDEDNEFLNGGTPGIRAFLDAVVYGKQSDLYKSLYENRINSSNSPCLYKQLKDFLKNDNNQIIEKAGVYYIEDLNSSDEEPEINKTKKRIITYVLQNKT